VGLSHLQTEVQLGLFSASSGRSMEHRLVLENQLDDLRKKYGREII